MIPVDINGSTDYFLFFYYKLSFLETTSREVTISFSFSKMITRSTMTEKTLFTLLRKKNLHDNPGRRSSSES